MSKTTTFCCCTAVQGELTLVSLPLYTVATYIIYKDVENVPVLWTKLLWAHTGLVSLAVIFIQHFFASSDQREMDQMSNSCGHNLLDYLLNFFFFFFCTLTIFGKGRHNCHMMGHAPRQPPKKGGATISLCKPNTDCIVCMVQLEERG